MCLSGKNLLLDPRPVTSAKKRNDIMQKPVGPLTSRMGATSLMVEGRGTLASSFPLPSAKSGVGKLFCEGLIVSILGFAGHMVLNPQLSSRREYINEHGCVPVKHV